ncbi:hypothetical protein GOODEAATRI_008182 [Goodea atripinnis]|uniref:Uncharacterized protein n=1 Tax=Goodea atripinnis TaxID=208336 RepID=A0ABV0PWB3_9TELE
MTVYDIICFSFPRVPNCLVCLLSPTVNLWTMFQAAQKLGGYELVSIHICGEIFPSPPSFPPLILFYSLIIAFFCSVSDTSFTLMPSPTCPLSFSSSFLSLASFHPREITVRRQWKHVYDELGGNPSSTSAATCTRRHYER